MCGSFAPGPPNEIGAPTPVAVVAAFYKAFFAVVDYAARWGYQAHVIQRVEDEAES
jgi:hypothetical protein